MVFVNRFCKTVTINDVQFDFMFRKGTTDAVFACKGCKRSVTLRKNSACVLHRFKDNL